MKALVIELAFPGDVIISLSLAAELRRLEPNAEVTYLVRPDAAPLASKCPSIDRTITFDKRGSASGDQGIRMMVAKLNDLGFDTVFLLHSSERSQRLVSQLSAPTKIGFENVIHANLTHPVRDSGWSNRYERAILLLSAIYQGVDLSTLPVLEPVRLQAVDDFFGLDANVVTLAPGSAWKTKQWGDDQFANLSQSLTAKGHKLIVVGGPEDKPIGERIVSLSGTESVLNLAGQASLMESAYAIQRSRLLIGNDSAPGHLAVAVGTPVLTIFGPTVPEFGFAPPPRAGESHELVGLWCRPCTSHGSNICPIYTHECMTGIDVESVRRHSESMLNR